MSAGVKPAADRGDGEGGAVTASELRDRANNLHRALVTGSPNKMRRHGDYLLFEIPVGPGLLLAVEWVPSLYASHCFFQVLRAGPGDSRTTASGMVRIDDGALPEFAAAIAKVLELAAEHRQQSRATGVSP